jgi:amidophosphoribosyltransferase
VVGLTQKGELFAFRDSLGIRPLCYGWSNDGKTFAVSSESVGLSINDFRHESDVKPGELLTCSEKGFKIERLIKPKRRAFCSFELAYFARPDSFIEESKRPVYKIREDFGRNFGIEDKNIHEKIDVIASIPETGDDAAYGMHEQTNIPWERAVRKNRNVTDRAFISTTKERDAIIKKKINISSSLNGKRVAVVEDSVVRGDTSRGIIERIRNVGAKKVHMYITYPRIISPCLYGIDMSTFGELLGSKHNEAEIAKIIGADSVHYQSIENFIKATGLKKEELCLACLTCKYPTPLAQKLVNEIHSKLEKGKKERGRVYENKA